MNSITQISTIQKCVAEHFNLQLKKILGGRKCREFVRPRMLAMFLCKEMTDYSYSVIAHAFQRDHTTVLHAVKTMQTLFRSHPELETMRSEIVARIRKCPEYDLGTQNALFLTVALPGKGAVNGQT